MSLPTVRAARLRAHGDPLAIEEVSLGQPGPDEVRVRLLFAAVNPIDRYIAQGRVAPDGPLPRTLGSEASGTVDGRQVLVAGGGLGRPRWRRAQEAIAPRLALIDFPTGVGAREAAAMGIAGLTAFNCVTTLAKVTAEDRVLVLGASGGVGAIIVGLCARAGATVWGQTGSAAKAEAITADGAQR